MGTFHDLGLQSTGLTGRTQCGLEKLKTLAEPLYKTRTGQVEIYGLFFFLFLFWQHSTPCRLRWTASSLGSRHSLRLPEGGSLISAANLGLE